MCESGERDFFRLFKHYIKMKLFQKRNFHKHEKRENHTSEHTTKSWHRLSLNISAKKIFAVSYYARSV